MSTFFFKTAITNQDSLAQLKPHLEKLENEKSIERWHVDLNHPEHILEVETNQLSSEELKHILRETGVDVEFTKAPQAR